MQINITTDIDKTVSWLDRTSKQVRFASAVALTRTAKQGADDMRKQFTTAFNAPTRYTLNSVFSSVANKNKLSASFGLKDQALVQKSGGYSPAQVLQHHFTGGTSSMARYEVAFKRIGMLRSGEDIVPASKLNELNQFGNVPPSLIVKLISYFGGFGQQGYKANSTIDTRAKLAKRTDKNTKGKKQTKYARINGVVYFYANGSDHLHRGIWAKSGTHGADVRPILMFVKRGSYRQRFNLNTFAAKARTDFIKNFDQAYQQALATAR